MPVCCIGDQIRPHPRPYGLCVFSTQIQAKGHKETYCFDDIGNVVPRDCLRIGFCDVSLPHTKKDEHGCVHCGKYLSPLCSDHIYSYSKKTKKIENSIRSGRLSESQRETEEGISDAKCIGVCFP